MWKVPALVTLNILSVIISNMNTFVIMNCFCCFAWMGSMMLQVLIDDIVATGQLNGRIHVSIIDLKIMKWKEFYRLVDEYLHQLNRCFGLILLCYTTKTFVSTVTFTFSLFYVHFGVLEMFASSRVLATHLLCFSVLVSICHRIQGKVNWLLFKKNSCNCIILSLAVTSSHKRAA